MYTKLIPILAVNDVLLEKAFYINLGFENYVDPVETYPEQDFAALKHGEAILFGLMRSEEKVNPSVTELIWQIETTDIEAVYQLALEHKLEILSPLTMQRWGRKTMASKSPTGYEVGFEEA
jgi:predicted enzyme related to lactoylglutathione lyase